MGGIQYWFSWVMILKKIVVLLFRCSKLSKLNAANKYEPDLSAQQM